MAIDLTTFSLIIASYAIALIFGWFVSGKPKIYFDVAFTTIISIGFTFFSLLVMDTDPLLGYAGIGMGGLIMIVIGLRINQTYSKPIKKATREIMVMNEEKDFQNIGNLDFIHSYDRLKKLFEAQHQSFKTILLYVDTVNRFENQIDTVVSNIKRLSEQIENDNANLVDDIDENLQSAVMSSEVSDKIQNTVKELSDEFNKFNHELSRQIKVTDNLSDQTNLVAVNAAIEAARSDEGGENFAIVADGIQRLSSRSRDTASNLYKFNSGLGRMIAEKLNQISFEFSSLDELIYKISEQSDRISNVSHEQKTLNDELNRQLQILTERKEELSKMRKEFNY